MGRMRRWAYMGLGMLAWRVGKHYMRNRMRGRGGDRAGAGPPASG